MSDHERSTWSGIWISQDVPSQQTPGSSRQRLPPASPFGEPRSSYVDHADTQRLSTTLPLPIEARNFLRHLQSNHPQLLYKSLFACAAAVSPPTLGPSLKLVLALSEILGHDRFWTDADPQMVAIVLMGNASTSKGKGKEGQTPRLVVKLGRYAVLFQLLKALGTLESAAKIENRLKGFAEQMESRLAVMLEAEVSLLTLYSERLLMSRRRMLSCRTTIVPCFLCYSIACARSRGLPGSEFDHSLSRS